MASNRIGKYAWLELERRFLLRIPPPGLSGGWRITDRYISGTRLRLRRMAQLDGVEIVCKLGQKFRGENQRATETTMTTMYLTTDEFDRLAVLDALELVKVRYPYKINGFDCSIDVFQEKLDGLVIAEVEALSTESLMRLEPQGADWIEVTEEPFFTGGSLVKLTREQFLFEMDRWN